MADIVNKVLKILVISLFLSTNCVISREVPVEHLKNQYRNDLSRKLDFQKGADEDVNKVDTRLYHGNGLERDIYDDDDNYDQLGSWKTPEPNHASLSDTASNDLIIQDPDEAPRSPRLVNRDLTSSQEANIPAPAGETGMAANDVAYSGAQGQTNTANAALGQAVNAQEPGTIGQSAASNTDSQNLPPVPDSQNVVPIAGSQNSEAGSIPGNQYAPSNSETAIPAGQNAANNIQSQYAPGVGSGNVNEDGVLQPENQGSSNEANNQNLNTAGESGTSSSNNAYGPGNPSEDLLSQQTSELKSMYGQQQQQQQSQQNTDQSASSGDACLLKPCLNSGVCIRDPAPRGFECICDGGFQGRDCETKILPCDMTGCSTLGFCVAVKSEGLCMCKTQYTVKFCSVKMPPGVLETVESKIEEEVKVLTSGNKKYKLIAGAALFVMFCIIVHIYRVAKRRNKLNQEYQNKLKHDEMPANPPPGLLNISNMLCREFFFCCGNPADSQSKDKETGSTMDVELRKRSGSLQNAYKVLPDENIGSRSRLPSKANLSSRSHLSRTHLAKNVPSSTLRTCKSNLGSYASFSKGHLSRSNLDDAVSHSKSRLSKTRLDNEARLSKSHSADPVSYSKSQLSKVQLADDVSFNARTRAEMQGHTPKKLRGQLKQIETSKFRSHLSRGKSKRIKRTKREDEESEEGLLSDSNSGYLSSTSDTDTASDDTKRWSDQYKYKNPFKERRRSTVLSEGLDTEGYSTNKTWHRQSDIIYPSISSRTNQRVMNKGRPYIRYPTSIEQRPYEMMQTENRSHTAPFLGAHRGIQGQLHKHRPYYASNINTNNNNHPEGVNRSNNYILDNCSENLQLYANQEDAICMSEANTFGFNEQEHFFNNVDTANDSNGNGRPAVQNMHAENESASNGYQLSQCLHDSQDMLRFLAEQYSDNHQMGDFNKEIPSSSYPQQKYSHYQNSVTQCVKMEDSNIESSSFDKQHIHGSKGRSFQTNEISFITIDVTDSGKEDNQEDLTTHENVTDSVTNEFTNNVDIQKQSESVINKSRTDKKLSPKKYVNYYEREGKTFCYVIEGGIVDNTISKTDNKNCAEAENNLYTLHNTSLNEADRPEVVRE